MLIGCCTVFVECRDIVLMLRAWFCHKMTAVLLRNTSVLWTSRLLFHLFVYICSCVHRQPVAFFSKLWHAWLSAIIICMRVTSVSPDFLSELRTPVAQHCERRHLSSSLPSLCLLVVPWIQLNMYSRLAFAVVGPTVWNSLSNDLRDPDLNIVGYGHLLKMKLYQQYSVHHAH